MEAEVVEKCRSFCVVKDTISNNVSKVSEEYSEG
jgi:hypothetical protein